MIPTDGFEYSNDGATWQTGNVFTNLSADTTYTFYQRVKASSIALVSQVSQGTSVTFKSAQVTPAAPIISSFTDTVVTLIPVNGCEYSVDGVNWQSGNVFTDLSPATQYTLYQRKAETETCEASDASSTGITTDKSKQLLVPVAPTVQSFTSDSITLMIEAGCEYSQNGRIWQSSNVFGGLSCGTEFTFYQRYKETTSTYAGKSSEVLVAKTDKGTQSKPSAPTLSEKTYNSVTLQTISGYEYSRDGINWQTSAVFTDLSAETNYMFYQRKAETDTHYASEASTYIIVKTAEAPECVVDPSLHSYTNACDSSCDVCGAIRTITHAYAEATCTAPKTCNVCGDTQGEALGHDMGQWETTKEATCMETGGKRRDCSHCDYFETDVISATGHSYNAVVTDPTCIEQGYTTHTCHCGDTYVDTYVGALDHSFTDYKSNNDATCTVDGTETAKCDRCEETHTRTEEGSATGHSHTAIVTAPTCLTEGYTTHTCACGDSYKDAYVDALGHSFTDYKSNNNATCTKDGTKTAKCDRCDKTDTRTDKGSAKGHTEVTDKAVAATCTKAGKTAGKHCSVCGTVTVKQKTVAAKGHSYKTTTTKATASKNGKIVKKCTVCNKVASETTIRYAKSFQLSATSYTYNGKAKTPSVTVKDSAGKTLKKNTDYTVSYASGRKNAGTYKVTITLKGNYTGAKTLTFKIKPLDISKCSIKLSDTSFTYNGKVRKPSVTVKNASGTKLKAGTHYTVTYAKGRKNVGTYKVTVKMKGNYTGTKTLTFKIVPKAASINKLTAKSKAIIVKLNRSLQQSTGYEIQYSTKKNFSGAKTKVIKSYKTSSVTLTGLKAKTTYYIRIRTYKTVDGVKYYSNWCTYKNIKTK